MQLDSQIDRKERVAKIGDPFNDGKLDARLVSVAKYISPFKLRVFTLVFRAIFLAVYMCIASTYFI